MIRCRQQKVPFFVILRILFDSIVFYCLIDVCYLCEKSATKWNQNRLEWHFARATRDPHGHQWTNELRKKADRQSLINFCINPLIYWLFAVYSDFLHKKDNQRKFTQKIDWPHMIEVIVRHITTAGGPHLARIASMRAKIYNTRRSPDRFIWFSIWFGLGLGTCHHWYFSKYSCTNEIIVKNEFAPKKSEYNLRNLPNKLSAINANHIIRFFIVFQLNFAKRSWFCVACSTT